MNVTSGILATKLVIDAAYQLSGGKKSYASDAERVAFLFELYQRITSLLPATAANKKRKSKATESYCI